MILNFLRRAGIGLLAALAAAAADYFNVIAADPGSIGELGMYAGVAAAIAGLLAGGFNMLRERILDWLGNESV